MGVLKHLMCFTILAILSEPTVGDVRLDVSTPEIKVGCTDILTITCSVKGETRSDIKYLISMMISLRNESSYTDVANIIHIAKDEVIHGFYENVTVWGNVTDLSVVYLTAEWRNPTERLAGDYRCIVNGLDEVGHSLTLSKDASVASDATFAIDAYKIKEIEAQVEEKWNTMKNELIAENESWTRKFQELQNVLFSKETFYNHHHYFLSRHVYNNIDIAIALCHLCSGYLVQIDDSDEYNAILSFLSGVTEFDSVFISGTVKGSENLWVYQGSNTSMPFQLWGPSAPGGGDKQSCVLLWKKEGWKMYDAACYDNEYKVSAICEKPMVV